VSEDVSSHAHRRERRLHSDLATARVPFFPHPGVTVVPPGDLAPPGADHYRVFTPYWRRWSVHPRRIPLAAPRRLASPAGVDGGQLPELAELVPGRPAPESPGGGETAGRRRLHGWLRDDGARYEARRDVPADDCTTRLGAYIHLGCVSPLAVATAAQDAGAVDLVRQLAWRDFFHQVLAADPRRARGDMYDGRRTWIDDPTGVDAWRDGQTGYPFVDAGMRQLRREGFMHNRARLVTASFLTRSLSVDWRVGADHFAALLADADVASNAGNWQWVAGTGANSRPNRVLSPIRQAHRFDPNGDYVRRYVPELAAIPDGRIHEPWALGVRRPPAYPDRVAVGDEARRPAPRRRGRLVRRRCGTPGTPPRSRG
jgi:deoxyribodipyrimidine photo-lyase